MTTNPRKSRLVGRSTELSEILRMLHEARRGGGRMVTVEGEAGIGKTRLLEVAAQTALRRGMLAIYAAADEDLRAPFIWRGHCEYARLRDPGQRSAARDALDRALTALAGEPGVSSRAAATAFALREGLA